MQAYKNIVAALFIIAIIWVLCLHCIFKTIISVLGLQSLSKTRLRRRPRQFSLGTAKLFCLLSRPRSF
jgi:hypothetical protein